MKQIGAGSALALCALLACTAQARQVQGQAQVQPQAQNQQQARQAQAARQQAEAYLRREESAATGRRNQTTDSANQDAGVADEAAGHSDAARPARSANPAAGSSAAGAAIGAGPGSPTPPSYGPVLKLRQPQAADPARKDPAEIRDETDTLTREAPAQPSQQSQQQDQRKTPKQAKQAQRRREAWQPAGPLAPRPLSGGEAPAIGYGALAIPAPAQAPQPVVPSTGPMNCAGGVCRDSAGGTYNLGPTGTGVSSSGRLCTGTGTTVQCF
jgi:hypothetical protein